MSVSNCAKCEKTVYPLEEVKCLDKVWHKACFKCQSCNMTLSMRNYKGFDKLPYCGVHVPKAKATIVIDTPEMKRLAENSKNQSVVKYHADFEATRGKFTTIADDPEIQRIKANTQTISNITYHGIAEQKADQEKRRGLVEGLSNKTEESAGERSSSLSHDSSPEAESVAKLHHTHDAKTFNLNSKLNDPTASSHVGKLFPNFDKHDEKPDEKKLANQPNFPINSQRKQTWKCYQALYDYEAQDVDEVSFQDGDIIVNCTAIDEGWMTGTIYRTGKHGMLPANYVEGINL